MQILKISPKQFSQKRVPSRNLNENTMAPNFSNIADTVTFGINQNTAVMTGKTQKLLSEVLEKLNLKNSNMSKGYAKAIRNDIEAQAYYENTENLITHIRKLFCQSPDGKIVTFEKIDGVNAPDEYRIEQLVPMKNTNKYTGIHITADNTFLVTGEVKELGGLCKRPSHTAVNTKSTIEQFNKTAQKCLNELLSDKNTQF